MNDVFLTLHNFFLSFGGFFATLMLSLHYFFVILICMLHSLQQSIDRCFIIAVYYMHFTTLIVRGLKGILYVSIEYHVLQCCRCISMNIFLREVSYFKIIA